MGLCCAVLGCGVSVCMQRNREMGWWTDCVGTCRFSMDMVTCGLRVNGVGHKGCLCSPPGKTTSKCTSFSLIFLLSRDQTRIKLLGCHVSFSFLRHLPIFLVGGGKTNIASKHACKKRNAAMTCWHGACKTRTLGKMMRVSPSPPPHRASMVPCFLRLLW